MSLVKVTNISRTAVGSPSFFLRPGQASTIDSLKIKEGEQRLQQRGLITIEPADARPAPAVKDIGGRVIQLADNIPEPSVEVESVGVEEPMITITTPKEEQPPFASQSILPPLQQEEAASPEASKEETASPKPPEEAPGDPLFYNKGQLEGMKMSEIRDIATKYGVQKSRERNILIEGILQKQQG